MITTRLLGFFTSVLIMSLAGLFLAIWKKRHPLHKGPFRWGILTWILAWALGYMAAQKFGTAVAGTVALFLPDAPESVQINFAVALIYAAIETSLILWVVLKRPYQESNWEAAICFGLGYGAAEAVTYGFLHLVFWIRPDVVPQASQDVLLGMSGFAVVAPLVERLFSYLTHMYGALLVFYAVRFRIWKWLIAAFCYKLLFYSMGAAGWGLAGPDGLGGELRNLLVLELGIIALGGLGLAGLLHMGYLYHRAGDGPGLGGVSDPVRQSMIEKENVKESHSVQANEAAKKEDSDEKNDSGESKKSEAPPMPEPPKPPPPKPESSAGASDPPPQPVAS